MNWTERTEPVALERVRTDVGDLRRRADHQLALAAALVRIEPVSQWTIATEIDAIERALCRAHPLALDPILTRMGRTGSPGPSRVLLEEHRRFLGSIDQLRWLFGVIQGEDHGGHRQALGQYWMILLESVGRHLDEEMAYLDAFGEPPPGS